MRTRTKVLAVLTAFVAGCVWCAVVEGAPKSQKTTTESTSTPKKENWVVVEMKDLAGKVSFEAVTTKEFAGMPKKLNTEFADAMKKWQADRAKAIKDKVPFDEKKPLKPSVTKRSGVINDHDKAVELARKLQAAYEERQAKKDEAPKATTPPTGEVVKPAENVDETKPVEEPKPETKPAEEPKKEDTEVEIE